MTTTIRRIERRDTGEIRYTMDDGSPQLVGPWYDSREDAEAAMTAKYASPATARIISRTTDRGTP